MIKLNLGCGLDKREGYVNVDVRKDVNPDVTVDLEKELLSRWGDGTIEEILAKDFLEHLSWRRVRDFLRDCYRCLKKGGKLLIQTPDLEAIAKKFVLDLQYSGDFEELSYWVYGCQDYPENLHKAGFTIQAMKKLLEEIGFQVLEIRGDGGTNMLVTAVKT